MHTELPSISSLIVARLFFLAAQGAVEFAKTAARSSTIPKPMNVHYCDDPA
jgi:hypothetical protein